MALTSLIPWRRPSSARLDPMSSVGAMQREMNRMFEEFWGNGGMRAMSLRPLEEFNVFMPTVEVSERKDKVRVSAEIPGMKEQDIDVSLSPDNLQLTISGEKKLERKHEDEDFYHCERAYGAFRRTINLPSVVDPNKIDATYRGGVLEIELKKSDNGEQGVKHIKIKPA